MTAGTSGAAASTAAARIRATQASGAIVKVKAYEFLTILKQAENLLVVSSAFWLFGTKYQYLTAYKGLIFYADSDTRLPLPADIELVEAEKIWVPR